MFFKASLIGLDQQGLAFEAVIGFTSWTFSNAFSLLLTDLALHQVFIAFIDDEFVKFFVLVFKEFRAV